MWCIDIFMLYYCVAMSKDKINKAAFPVVMFKHFDNNNDVQSLKLTKFLKNWLDTNMKMAGCQVKRRQARVKAGNCSGNKGRRKKGAAADWRDLQGERVGVGSVRILSRKEAQGSWSLWRKWWDPWRSQQVHVRLHYKGPLNFALYHYIPEETELSKWTLSKMNLCYSFNQLVEERQNQVFDIARCLYKRNM